MRKHLDKYFKLIDTLNKVIITKNDADIFVHHQVWLSLCLGSKINLNDYPRDRIPLRCLLAYTYHFITIPEHLVTVTTIQQFPPIYIRLGLWLRG
jgi:hypothetical protein